MEQRIYQGDLSPEGLADHLVQKYDPQEHVQAQKIGQSDSFLVQIGYGDALDKIRHALTVAIAKAPAETPGIVVTMGQRQWITQEEAAHAAFWGLLAVLVTPWVLFALLWPLSEAISATTLPNDIWNTVESYVISQGAMKSQSAALTHPHVS